MSIYALVPAAGLGSRMGAAESKVFLQLGEGINVLQLNLRNLVAARVLKGIALMVKPGEEAFAEAMLADEAEGLDCLVGLGGVTRQESVYNGLRLLDGKAEFVLVHDGARPFCSPDDIAQVASVAKKDGAAILATPAKQSIKEVEEGKVLRSLSRNRIWEAQTPQVFRYRDLYKAHEAAKAEGFLATDDSELVERIGLNVSIVQGEDTNIKLTTPRDLAFARFIQTKSF